MMANQQQNPDSRIRKSAAVLLDAMTGIPHGHAAHLLEQRNHYKILKLIQPVPSWAACITGRIT